MKRCLNCMEEYADGYGSCPGCGYQDSFQGQEDCLMPGTIIQRRYIVGCCKYQQEEETGYIGWDGLFERKVLIREYYIQGYCQRMINGGVEAENRAVFEKAAEDFIETGRQLIRLYKETDIQVVYSAFRENGTGYIIAQYLPEEAALQASWDMIGPGGAELLLREILTAMDKCHSARLYFGGITPDQVYCTRDGVVLGGQRRLAEGAGQSQKQDIYGAAALFCMLAAGEPYDRGKKSLSRELGLLSTELNPRQMDVLKYILEDRQPQLSVSSRELKEVFSEAGQHTTLQLLHPGGKARALPGAGGLSARQKLFAILGISFCLAVGMGIAIGALMGRGKTKAGGQEVVAGTETAGLTEKNTEDEPEEQTQEPEKETSGETETEEKETPKETETVKETVKENKNLKVTDAEKNEKPLPPAETAKSPETQAENTEVADNPETQPVETRPPETTPPPETIQNSGPGVETTAAPPPETIQSSGPEEETPPQTIPPLFQESMGIDIKDAIMSQQ